MRLHSLFYLLFGSLVAACGSAVDDPPLARSGAAGPAIEGPTTEAGGFAPQVNWKAERKRLAMLGLAYDSGRAVVVPSEATSLLASIENTADADLLPALLREGHEALGENRALDAIAIFTKAVLLEPKVADHYAPLGRALQAFNLESQAVAAWETGHELDSEHSQLAFHVADMAYRLGNPKRARTLFERNVSVNPNHAASWGRLARLSYFENSDDDAWRQIHRAEELGETIPAVMRARLAMRSSEPQR